MFRVSGETLGALISSLLAEKARGASLTASGNTAIESARMEAKATLNKPGELGVQADNNVLGQENWL
ncbi:hypothetical protein [Cupriavidus necator]|uniref:hypothetical protein n=1 Tax=Cupriavidus necator TaxID=106590 RepID=UPI003C6C1A62